MADKNNKVPENVPGPWYVDNELCTPCRVCLDEAPELLQVIVLEDTEKPVIDLIIDERKWSEGPGQAYDLTRLVLQPGEEYIIDWILPSWRKDTAYFITGLWGTRHQQEVPLVLCQASSEG
jgi:ferredoxin